MLTTRRNRYTRFSKARAVKAHSKTPRFALSVLLMLGLLTIGATIVSNLLSPRETQSSIDRAAMDAARHEFRNPPTAGMAADEFQDNDLNNTDDIYAEAQDAETTSDTGADEQDLPVAEAPQDPDLVRMTGLVKNGDTPSSLLEGHLDMAEIHTLCDESKKFYSLSNLKAGQPLTMIYAENALVGLEYEIDGNERLVVTMSDKGYEFKREPIPYVRETITLTGTIQSSLFATVHELGESEDLAVRLANVFAYDVDFVRGLRVGDSFKVVVEKRFREGKFVGYGSLAAASFTNQGKTFYAYRYTDHKSVSAYYDATGRPLRKAFLKAPVPFTRISSGYSMNRLHPILGYHRPHQGIDYAAPTGTPISTVADGVILEAGRNESQGLYVRVGHSNSLETIYNHMSKFASISKRGSRVRQGEVIGFVGSTGYATGPHLDFRMRQNGALINPQTLKNIPADPIPTREMAAFRAVVAAHRPQLEAPTTADAHPGAAPVTANATSIQ